MAFVTDDLRGYHELVPVFSARGIQLLGLRPDEAVPPSVRALIDGPPNDPRTVPRHAHDDATFLAVAQTLDDRPTARPTYRCITFGVDPGKTIGLAVLADGAAFMVAHEQTVSAAVARLLAWNDGLVGAMRRIHIGDGHAATGQQLFDAVQEAFPDALVAFVPEHATTPASPVTASRHTDAAIHIALRSP